VAIGNPQYSNRKYIIKKGDVPPVNVVGAILDFLKKVELVNESTLRYEPAATCCK